MEIKYELTIETDGKKRSLTTGWTELEKEQAEKWEEIKKLCEYRKASIYDLISDILEKLTIEEAEQILISWDM